MASSRRDVLFEAVAETVGTDWRHLTRPARGSLNRAVADIRAVLDPTEDPVVQVWRKAAEYRARMPDAMLTAPALAKHWPSLNGDPATLKGRRGSIARAAMRALGGEP